MIGSNYIISIILVFLFVEKLIKDAFIAFFPGEPTVSTFIFIYALTDHLAEHCISRRICAPIGIPMERSILNNAPFREFRISAAVDTSGDPIWVRLRVCTYIVNFIF